MRIIPRHERRFSHPFTLTLLILLAKVRLLKARHGVKDVLVLLTLEAVTIPL